jgi:hypothetical protein
MYEANMTQEHYEYVCRTETEKGVVDYVTLLPPEITFQHGLAPEAIVGVLSRPIESGEAITPEIFSRNRVFVDFLHKIVARYAPESPACQEEAKRVGNGCVAIIDQRTPTPKDGVPPEDIIGAFEVKDGAIVPGSYRASPNHRILSERGFFRLDAELHQRLLQELAALKSA